MKIVPMGDRILVVVKEETPKEVTTKSGIILTEEAKKKSRQRIGTVVKVGKGRYEAGKRMPMDIEEGNKVIFDFGEEITIEGEDYYILREIDVLAVIL